MVRDRPTDRQTDRHHSVPRGGKIFFFECYEKQNRIDFNNIWLLLGHLQNKSGQKLDEEKNGGLSKLGALGKLLFIFS